jgi:hypothetical protein
LALVFDAMLLLVFRTRTTLVSHLLAVGFGALFYAAIVWPPTRPTVAVRHGPGGVLKLAVFGAAVAVIAVSTRFARGYWETGAVAELSLETIGTVGELTFLGGDLGYHLIVMRVMQMVDSGWLSISGDSYLRLVLLLLPGSLTDIKPPDPQNIIGAAIYPEVLNITVPPGILGDAYVNLGLFAPVVFAVIGIALMLADRFKSLSYFVFCGIAFTTVFHFVRGAVANSLIIFVALVAAAIVFDRFARWRGPSSNGTMVSQSGGLL